MSQSPPPIAHSPREPGQPAHDLVRHLRETQRLAGGFAALWGAEAAAARAGLWHDLGKFRPEVQAWIGRDPDGHLEGLTSRPNHSYAGAQLASQSLGPLAPLVAMAIAGHHAGLPDWAGCSRQGLQQSLGENGKRLLAEAQGGGVPRDLIDLPPLPDLPPDIDAGLWGRMLASALVDADFLDTEAYYDQGRTEKRQGWASLDDLRPRFEAGLADRLAQARTDPKPIDPLRDSVLAACRATAAGPVGLYALTVPTGGGKTLASLAFAFDHAKANGLRRVIYAAPFTTILDQTADVFRAVLDDRNDAVLEHHSAVVDPQRDDERLRLAAENWDAPVVVTTNVQLFDSLFGARVSQIRKLHNLAGSVLILDEVQALPAAVLAPITAILGLLPSFGVTVVLCTATQPALGAVFKGLVPTPIIPASAALFDRLDRVTIDIRPRESWDSIAARLGTERQVLAIVNTRKDCRQLHAQMPEGTIHLSAWQCAAHRRDLLAEIKRRLAVGEPVRVVSTSLVEAGVDLDFPVVARAMAGLDTLAQAAGRCNRNAAPDKGRFIIFDPDQGGLSSAAQGQAISAARTILAKTTAAPFDPATIEDYFRLLYWAQGAETHDEYRLIELLRLPRPDGKRQWGKRHDLSYRTAAERFRMIDDDWQAPLVVACADSQTLIEQVRAEEPTRALLRAVQPFIVQVSTTQRAALAEEVNGIWVLRDPRRYDKALGLRVED